MKNKNIKFIVIIVILIITGIILFREIFSEGPLTRSDNPVHLVEVEYLKEVLIPKYHWINGWYPFVFMGIPIQLYSHQLGIWLTALLSMVGISTVLSYKVILLISFICPAIMLFYLLKKRFGIIAAFIPGLFFLFQREYNHLLIAGMWNSGLGLIFLILQMHFIDKYKNNISAKRIAIISLLQSITILSHLYVGLSSFILIISASLLQTYRYKNKGNLLWIISIPLSILIVAFYIFPFIETNAWLNESFGWGLGNNIIEIIYKLIGIFLSLKQNTYFLTPLINHAYLEAIYYLMRDIIINLPTIIIDTFGVIGFIKYIKHRKNEKLINNLEFLDLITMFTLFMLIIGSGFWFMFDLGHKIPFLSGIIPFKFIYYARISLYIFAALFLHNLIKGIRTKKSTRKIIKYSIYLSLFMLIIFNNLYMPDKGNTETLSKAEIGKETREIWNWMGKNIEKDIGIIDPITFKEGIASQSTILALTPLYTNVSMLSTWVISYYPIEKYLSSDDLKLFNIPRDKITTEQIKENMLEFNVKYLLTIDKDMKEKLSKDKVFRLKKEFITYSIYEIAGYKPSLIEGNIKYKILEKTEQKLLLEINNTNEKEEKINIKIAYHPYWMGYINGKRVEINKSYKELIEINVPNGVSFIELNYNSINNNYILISLISFIITASLLFKRANRKIYIKPK